MLESIKSWKAKVLSFIGYIYSLQIDQSCNREGGAMCAIEPLVFPLSLEPPNP